jgi:hypothetical protein
VTDCHPSLPKEWTFTCSIQQPDSMRVECTIYVPESAEYDDILEVSEMVQMGAVRAFHTLRRSRTTPKAVAF